MSARPVRPRPPLLAWGTAVGLAVLAWVASGATLGAPQYRGAADRLAALLVAFVRPDLSADALTEGLRLAAQTVAVATWGTALGALGGFGLGLLASERIAHADGRPRTVAVRLRVEVARGVLDVLRAIPDFAWALLVLVLVGPGPITGTVAIAVGATGMLGKTYSQLLDATPPASTRSVELTGASRTVVALWGYVPAAAGGMLSYTLLRLECSMRNASVIGIVGGGGLGAALFEEFGFGRYDRVATLLLLLLLLTGLTDAVSKGVARALRRGARPTRQRLGLAAGLVLGVTSLGLAPAVPTAVAELSRLDAAFLTASGRALLSPSLDLEALGNLARDAAVPLGIAYLATGSAAALAVMGLLVVPRMRPSSRAPRVVRLAHALALRSLDLLALLTRAIPDVVWLLLYGVVLRVGPLAAIAAIATHSFGLLARLMVEAVDDVPVDRIEARALGSPRSTFAWSVWPEIAPVVRTHVSLQAESNLRAGLIVGIVGAGGLGDAFASSVTYWRLGDASLQALAMIGLTVGVDRIARRLSAA